MKVLLTGATGFVGSHLARELDVSSNYEIKSVARGQKKCEVGETVNIESFDGKTNWSDTLKGIETIIHMAARVHVMRDQATEPLEEYRRVNVEGTLNLFRQASITGVKRFIFISSIKVNGEHTKLETPFRVGSHPAPKDDYALSKFEAECGLLKLADKSALELVIIRAPVVYGARVKGNVARLVWLIEKGWPLPLGSIHNKRSFMGLDNLVDLIITCITHPNAANQVFLASDGHDLSTSELMTKMGEAMGKPCRLFSFPSWILMIIAISLGQRSNAQKLLYSLQVDITKARKLLDWKPPVSIDEGLRRCFAGQEIR